MEEVIERQLRKYKTKIVNQQQAGGNFQKEFVEDEFLEDEEVNIIRTKKFGIKPMYPEECMLCRLELLGHNFYVIPECGDR